MESIKTKLSDIKLNPNNPRLIKDDKFTKLVQSIKDFPEMLDIRPIVVNSDMVILGGNMRFKACKEAGLKEVPIVIADNLTEEQQREFLIKDNVSGGEWDFEMLANEWDNEQLEEWGLDIPAFETDEVLEAEEDDFDGTPPVEPITVLGDLYEIGEHRLLCGDSTDSDQVAKLMNGSKADMVFTDPPYNIDYQGVTKGNHEKIANDKMSDEDFTQFLYDALNINSDTFYVCCSWQYSHLFRKALEDLQKPVKAFIVWDKINPAQHLDKYFKQHEIILYHGKFGGQKTLRGYVWQTKRQKNTVHPTMKPIEIIEMALNDNLDKKNIYDAFLGSGSTMVASHQLKRKCYGMELDPKYCDVIVKRMIKLDPTLTIKRNGVVTNDFE
jgi:site-specific DNA-methyltransferase (adenine-specific)